MPYFRSVKMQLCQMVLHQETAFDCLVELGYIGKVQFNIKTQNRIINRGYAVNAERCIKLQQIIFRFYDELQKLGLKIHYEPNVDRDYKPKITDLNEIENELLERYQELNEVIQHCAELNNLCIELREQREVLFRVDKFLAIVNDNEVQSTSLHSMLSEVMQNNSTTSLKTLKFLTGTAPVQKFAAFELMVWRVSRGNAHIKHEEYQVIEEIGATRTVDSLKYTFILACVGDEMHEKLLKVCNGFGVKLYPCPFLDVERTKLFNSIGTELNDTEKIYMQTLEQKQRILNDPIMNLCIWRSKIEKIKAIYTVLSRFETLKELGDRKNKYLLAECWISIRKIDKVREALLRGAQRDIDGDVKNLVFPPILNEMENTNGLVPPTLFYTNKFTQAFQSIVNIYGIASYRELNPAPFTIVTFPFFFAIMFADMGHGILLTIAALCIILYKEKYIKRQRNKVQTNEILNLIVKGRYVILLMGLCSIYTGFIYNDFFAMTIQIYGSSWRVNFTENDVFLNKYYYLDPGRSDNFDGVPYLFGLDPIWNTFADNWIRIHHSLKSKVAVIMGVVHMLFGLILSAVNALYFNDNDEFYLNFLPKILFVFSIFAYLIILIIIKWVNFGAHTIPAFSPACAPSLFIVFLNMFLFLSPEKKPDGCSKYMYKEQPIHQYFLMLLAMICVLVILCAHPLKILLSYCREKIKSKRSSAFSDSSTNEFKRTYDEVHRKQRENEPKQKLADVFFNQVFIAAELVFGSISHVASYLRLWAVSMAHGEISFIVWVLILRNALRTDFGYFSPVILSIAFAFFAITTTLFLVIMEGVAIFIHTLRLHFFDFQFLFYKADGHPFMPFYFKLTKRLKAEM